MAEGLAERPRVDRLLHQNTGRQPNRSSPRGGHPMPAQRPDRATRPYVVSCHFPLGPSSTERSLLDGGTGHGVQCVPDDLRQLRAAESHRRALLPGLRAETPKPRAGVRAAPGGGPLRGAPPRRAAARRSLRDRRARGSIPYALRAMRHGQHPGAALLSHVRHDPPVGRPHPTPRPRGRRGRHAVPPLRDARRP